MNLTSTSAASPRPCDATPCDLPPRIALVAMCAITLLGAGLRIARLDHPARYDEAYTYLVYAGPTDPPQVFNYSAPNNHVLHTLAVHGVVRLAGPWLWAIRLPALLAGCLLIPLTGRLAQAMACSRLAGLVAAAMVAASSLMIEYSVNARGYSMLCLAAIASALLADACRRRSGRFWPWAGFAVVGSLGLGTIPVMLYPLAIVGALMALDAAVDRTGRERRLQLLRIAGTFAAILVLAAGLYLPVAARSGWASIVANEFITPQPFGQVIASLGGMVGRMLADWTRDAGPLLIAVVGGGVLLAWGWLLPRRRWLVLLPVATMIAIPLLSLLQRRVAFPRVWMFAWPWTLAVAGAGLGLAVQRIRRPGPPVRCSAVAALVIAGCMWSAWRSMQRPFLVSEDARTLTDARAIAADVATLSEGQTALVWAAPSGPPVYYYLMFQPEYRQPLVSIGDPTCRRAAIIVAPQQRLDDVLDGLGDRRSWLGEPTLWREYPRSRVYLAPVGGDNRR